MDIENGGAKNAHAEQNDTKMASSVESGQTAEEGTNSLSADRKISLPPSNLEEALSGVKSIAEDVVNEEHHGNHALSSSNDAKPVAAGQDNVDSIASGVISQKEDTASHGLEVAASVEHDQSLPATHLDDSRCVPTDPDIYSMPSDFCKVGCSPSDEPMYLIASPLRVLDEWVDGEHAARVARTERLHAKSKTNDEIKESKNDSGQSGPDDIKPFDPAPSVSPQLDENAVSSNTLTDRTDVSVTYETRDDISGSGKSDSEAETVLLPGIDGYSPSKIRKTIKLEDKPDDIGDIASVQEKHDDGVTSEANGEGSITHLGKRKRSRNGNGVDRQNVGYSSGLSSVPTSPINTSRANLRNSGNPDFEHHTSPSPATTTAKASSLESKTSLKQSRPDIKTGAKEVFDTREVQNSGLSTSDELAKAPKVTRAASHTEEPKRHNNARSISPHPEHHRRSISNQSGPSFHNTNHRKKRPGPLRTTRDRQSSDEDSSIGESPHPRRSRTRNLATPPTGESVLSSKMPKRRRLLYGSSALAVACEHGDVGRARQELQEAPDDLNSADNAGNTPLQCASINGHADVVRFLIEEGCDIHCVNNRKDSPLLDAVENSHLEVVRVLLAAGVNPRARNLEGEEPINKIDEEDEDADAIREALLAARPRAVAPDAVSHNPTAHTYAANKNNVSINPRTLSHGRSRRTGENQLFLQLNVASLRQAASTGDQETALRIVDSIGVNGLDDAESLVNAARGGHEDVLQLLMALGDANPDPSPLPHKDPEYATPILAAIGGDNLGVIKLLLNKIEDGKFDPTRKYNGRTYYEIARERAGPHWQEEERLLKEEFEKYNPSLHRGESNAHGNSRSGSKRQQEERSSGPGRSQSSGGVSHATKRDYRGSAADEAASKRGPGRPRKDGRERSVLSDHDTTQKKPTPKRSDSDTTTVPSESEPGKDHRKRQRLFSAKDLKRRMERRESIASAMSAEENPKSHTESTNSPADIGMRNRIAKDDEAKINNSRITHGDNAPKRRRSSVTPPTHGSDKKVHGSESTNLNKRRRLEPEQRQNSVASPRSSLSPDLDTPRRADEKPSLTSGINLSAATDGDSVAKGSKNPAPAAENEEAQIQREIDEERERKEQQRKDEELVRAEELRLVLEEVDKVKSEEKARFVKQREEQRQMDILKAQQAEAHQHEQEELRRHEAEEEERREQRRRQEAEAHARAEEERRRLYNEQQRMQREEQDRRRAAHIAQQRAERQRIVQEENEARLAKLPPLLRWFDGVENPLTPEFAYMFRGLQGVRYDTIRPEATGTAEGKEQWLLNVQVALLLGEKELAFPRYTHWTHIEVSDMAKRTLWKVLSEDYSCISEHLRQLAELPREPNGSLAAKMRNEAWPLFQEYPMFFVKLSDFMSIVPRYPHLKNVEILVKYRELPPSEAWLFKVTFPAKWKQDEDAAARLGFCPGTKYFTNGQLVRENKPKFARTSSTPFPSHRVPRIGGIHEVFPGNPSYEKLCKEQGLEHLLAETAAVAVPMQNGIAGDTTTPPDSNTTNEDDVRRLSAASSAASATDTLANGTAVVDFTEASI